MTIKIIPDTNILIRGFTSYLNKQRQLINLAVANEISFYGSKETLEEFSRKVRSPRFYRYLEPKILTPDRLIQNYRVLITLIEPLETYKTLHICRDPDDNIFIQIAKTCKNSIIVTEDKDLLSIKRYNGVRIINSEIFVKLYRQVYN